MRARGPPAFFCGVYGFWKVKSIIYSSGMQPNYRFRAGSWARSPGHTCTVTGELLKGGRGGEGRGGGRGRGREGDRDRCREMTRRKVYHRGRNGRYILGSIAQSRLTSSFTLRPLGRLLLHWLHLCLQALWKMLPLLALLVAFLVLRRPREELPLPALLLALELWA